MMAWTFLKELRRAGTNVSGTCIHPVSQLSFSLVIANLIFVDWDIEFQRLIVSNCLRDTVLRSRHFKVAIMVRC